MGLSREKFIPLCPDFVIEILSPSEQLKKAQQKMLEYQNNGCPLGWLINGKLQEVEIYCLGKEVEILKAPPVLSGEEILPEFQLNLQRLWS